MPPWNGPVSPWWREATAAAKSTRTTRRRGDSRANVRAFRRRAGLCRRVRARQLGSRRIDAHGCADTDGGAATWRDADTGEAGSTRAARDAARPGPTCAGRVEPGGAVQTRIFCTHTEWARVGCAVDVLTSAALHGQGVGPFSASEGYEMNTASIGKELQLSLPLSPEGRQRSKFSRATDQSLCNRKWK